MGTISTQVTSPPDSHLIRILRKVTESVGKPDVISYVINVGETDPISFSGNMGDFLADADAKALESSRGTLISMARLSLPHSVTLTVKRESGFATVVISFPKPPQPALHLPIIEKVNAAFASKVIAPSSLKTVLGPELAQHYQKREEALLRLEDLSEEIIRRTEEYRQDLDRQIAERRARLEAEYARRLELLEKEHVGREEILAEKTAALEARAKEIDDRSSRHARRGLRTELKRILQERNTSFALTKATQRKRLPIHALFIVLLLAFGLYAFDVVRDAVFHDGALTWTALVRAAFTLGSFGATCVFYIRWNDHWARQHAEEEFRLRQLELDVDRASWLVEMAMEWRDEKGTELPATLVDRLTRGLFDREAGTTAVRHPTEDLASALIGASSGLTVNVPGIGELRLDRNGIKRFARAVDDQQ